MCEDVTELKNVYLRELSLLLSPLHLSPLYLPDKPDKPKFSDFTQSFLITEQSHHVQELKPHLNCSAIWRKDLDGWVRSEQGSSSSASPLQPWPTAGTQGWEIRDKGQAHLRV